MIRGVFAAAGFALLTSVLGCAKDPTSPPEPVVTSLSCANSGGQFVACTLKLEAPAGFKVKLQSRDCRAHGNTFRITAPVEETLVSDGCYAPVGTEIVQPGPFPAN